MKQNGQDQTANTQRPDPVAARFWFFSACFNGVTFPQSYVSASHQVSSHCSPAPWKPCSNLDSCGTARAILDSARPCSPGPVSQPRRQWPSDLSNQNRNKARQQQVLARPRGQRSYSQLSSSTPPCHPPSLCPAMTHLTPPQGSDRP